MIQRPTRFIRPDRLEEDLRSLGSGLALTQGRFEFPADADRADIDWNHMDQLHRPWIHKTYEESIRLVVGEQFAVSVMKLKLLGFPVFVDVTDIQLGPGKFYQSYTLFGLIYVHTMIEHTDWSDRPNKIFATWTLTSHWLLKPLHWLLDRKLQKFNRVLNGQDVAVRKLRRKLKEDGYRSVFPEPNFYNSNTLTNNFVPPKPSVGEVRLPLASFPLNQREVRRLGNISLLVERQGENELMVWPEACPHEGGPLSEGKKCGKNEIECPWHGLKFRGVQLDKNHPIAQVSGLKLELKGDHILCTAEAASPKVNSHAVQIEV